MSQETMEWLQGGNILVGDTGWDGLAIPDQIARGFSDGADGVFPWWTNRGLLAGIVAGDAPNPFYAGGIPVEDVRSRLLNFRAEAFRAFTARPMVDGWTGPTIELDGETWRMVEDATSRGVGPDDRDDTFKFFSDGYNAENHQFSDTLVDASAVIVGGAPDDLHVQSSGLLRNRAVAWVQIGTGESSTTDHGVTFSTRLLAASSFDGTLATTWAIVRILAVCDNTLSAALGGSDRRVKVRHTRNSAVGISDARDALGIIAEDVAEATAEFDALCSATVTAAQWSRVLDALAPMPADDASKRARSTAESKRDALQTLYTADSRVTPWTGTAFGVLQAFNTWGQHNSRVLGDTHRAARNMENTLRGKIADADASVIETLAAVGVLQPA